ncbi:MAG: M48 family metalloprotease [Desulfobacterales bacterium]|nr:M48 family metalloprotease [Desulfobacterales bacterium]
MVVTDGLLRHLDPDETAAVLAHEISHLRHNDLRIMGFAAFSNQLVQMMALIGQLMLLFNLALLLWGQQPISWTAILLLIFAPWLSTRLQLALSRTREYRADFGAAELMGGGRALASALSKMESYQNRYLRGRLWPGYRPMTVATLLRTHPPTKERIRRLLQIGDRATTPAEYTALPRKHGFPRTLSRCPRRLLWNN